MKLPKNLCVALVAVFMSSIGIAGGDQIGVGHIVSPLNSEEIYVVTQREGSVLRVRKADLDQTFERVAPLEGEELRPVFFYPQNDAYLAIEQQFDVQDVQHVVIDFDAERQPFVRPVALADGVQVQREEVLTVEEMLEEAPELKRAGCCGCFGLVFGGRSN